MRICVASMHALWAPDLYMHTFSSSKVALRRLASRMAQALCGNAHDTVSLNQLFCTKASHLTAASLILAVLSLHLESWRVACLPTPRG